MAFGAHMVPVLVDACPVECIVMSDFFFLVQVKPPLSPFIAGPGVPGDTEGLEASVREFDKVLLKGIDAECKFYLVVMELPVWTVCSDHEFAVFLRELGFETVILELFIAEVPEHGIIACMLHGEVVVRALPEIVLRLVALHAYLSPDEIRGSRFRFIAYCAYRLSRLIGW